jgi:hypothetical protein
VAFQISRQFALLCEGPADQIFFKKLFAQRRINGFDIPTHRQMGDKDYGVDAFGKLLNSLAGDPSGYAGLRGILIVADSGDDVDATFRRVCRGIRRHGPFGSPSTFVQPNGAFQVTVQPRGHPAISIMLVPRGRGGALETICAEGAMRFNLSSLWSATG